MFDFQFQYVYGIIKTGFFWCVVFYFLDQVDDRSGSNRGITFATQRTVSNASTLSPGSEEEGEEEGESGEEGYFMGDDDMEEGPSFRLGSTSKVGVCVCARLSVCACECVCVSTYDKLYK